MYAGFFADRSIIQYGEGRFHQITNIMSRSLQFLLFDVSISSIRYIIWEKVTIKQCFCCCCCRGYYDHAVILPLSTVLTHVTPLSKKKEKKAFNARYSSSINTFSNFYLWSNLISFVCHTDLFCLFDFCNFYLSLIF